MPISFAMLLTLVSSSNAENAETLWGFIGRYRPGVTPKTHPELNELVEYASVVSVTLCCRKRNSATTDDTERAAFMICATRFRSCSRCQRPKIFRT